MEPHHEIVIVGGGINGLCTAYQLARGQKHRITLLEQFGLGHNRGSSHGSSRISRTTYASALYVRMIQEALKSHWPQLEKNLGATLLHPVPGCFFGPEQGLFQDYAAAVQEARADVKPLSRQEARVRFPQLHIKAGEAVLEDPSTAVIAASQLFDRLVEYLREQGVQLQDNTPVRELDITRDPIRIQTEHHTLRADRLIITAGAWTDRLVPQLKPRLSVVRRSVGYFGLKVPQQGRIPHYPIWVYLGHEPNQVHYGLPEFGQAGIKIARHITEGPSQDPDVVHEDPLAEEQLRAFVQERIALPREGVIRFERCLYTNAPNEDFILSPHPDNDNVVIGTGFSGHSFKFGPYTGQVLADLCLKGASSLPYPRIAFNP